MKQKRLSIVWMIVTLTISGGEIVGALEISNVGTCEIKDGAMIGDTTKVDPSCIFS